GFVDGDRRTSARWAVPLWYPHATVGIKGTLRGIEASSVTRRPRRVRRLKGELDQRRATEPVHNGLKPTPHVRTLLWAVELIRSRVLQHGSQAGRAWNPGNIASWRTTATPRCEEHGPHPDVCGNASCRCSPGRCRASTSRAWPHHRLVSTRPRRRYAET